MQLMVKRGLRPPNGSTLSYAEEKAAEQRISELEQQLLGKEVKQGLSFQPKDINNIEKWLKHYKELKMRGGAERFTGEERTRGEIELRRVVQAIAQKWGGRIPTWEEYWIDQRRGGVRYLVLRDKIVALNKDRAYAELIRRWKYLRRRMEPEDPNADSVLHLFKS